MLLILNTGKKTLILNYFLSKKNPNAYYKNVLLTAMLLERPLIALLNFFEECKSEKKKFGTFYSKGDLS